MQVIPVLNCQDLECINAHLRVAERFAERVHLDVADGQFTFHKNWNQPELWPKLKSHLKLEVHLMVEEPLSYAREWMRAGATRIIVHVESLDTETLGEIVALARERKVEVMLAMSPETQVQDIRVPLETCSAFQVLAVYPGLSDQKFIPLVVDKIKILRERFQGATIEVDGGINPKTAALVHKAGANSIASESYLFHHEDPLTAFKELSAL